MAPRESADPKAKPRAKRPPATPIAREHVLIGTALPRLYLHILEKESEAVGVRRGNLLEMLLKAKLGLLQLSRPTNAPDLKTYRFPEAELTQTERFSWVISPATKKLLDEHLLLAGNLSVAGWAVARLNEWLGRPGGFRRDKDGRLVF